MKVLFGYDGSSCADDAIGDLKRAGLPSRADCLIVSVADVWPPQPDADSDELVYAGVDQRSHARVLELRHAAKTMLADAASKAEDAARRIESTFPEWKVRSEGLADSPAWGILKRAEEWPADLIVVGSHGMTAAGRLFIGSVSHKVVTHASCSVRVARGFADKGPVRLIVGFDGSTDAEAAIREIASRSWPSGTEVHLVTAVDHRIITAVAAKVLGRPAHFDEKKDYRGWLSRVAEEAAEQLSKADLKTAVFLVDDEPRRALAQTAEKWRADCIFLGATGLRGLRRLLLGSVSSALAAHAPCTVEVVRPRLQ